MLVLVANQDFRCLRQAYEFSAHLDCLRQSQLSKASIPLSNDLFDPVVTIGFVRRDGNIDAKTPVIEQDSGRGYASRFDDQAYVAAQVG